jgi:hypothetical protein
MRARATCARENNMRRLILSISQALPSSRLAATETALPYGDFLIYARTLPAAHAIRIPTRRGNQWTQTAMRLLILHPHQARCCYRNFNSTGAVSMRTRVIGDTALAQYAETRCKSLAKETTESHIWAKSSVHFHVEANSSRSSTIL